MRPPKARPKYIQYVQLGPEAFVTRRQFDVIHYAFRGLSGGDIARELFIGEKTVKFHLTNIYKILKVRSKAEMLVLIYNLTKTDEDLRIKLGLMKTIDELREATN